MSEYKYGQPIPRQSRSRLYEWKGGGYDGCFWEMNQGLVDAKGHWHPLFSTGYDGIDQDDWYERKIEGLKSDLGYDCRPAKTQYDEAMVKAVEKVFGKRWYMKDGIDMFDDPRVKELTNKDQKRYDEFVKRRDEYRLERTHRLDEMFMQVVSGADYKECFQEIGRIDKKHFKNTCKEFCERYKSNVGMMCNALDAMRKLGYEPWCTCSDCGEQFQLGCYEAFSCLIDNNAYTGDGGIGVIMKRVLCDDCYSATECRSCYEHDLPNEAKPDKGASDWEDYDFLACLLYDWLDVCWGCSDGLNRDYLEYYDKALGYWCKTELGKKFDEVEKALAKEYGGEKHELYENVKKHPKGRKAINGLRDMLYTAARAKFSSSLDESWFDDRLDTDSPGQMKFPGIE